MVTTQVCIKGMLKLCHCKEKNQCQSISNVVDTAYTIFKKEDAKAKAKRPSSLVSLGPLSSSTVAH